MKVATGMGDKLLFSLAAVLAPVAVTCLLSLYQRWKKKHCKCLRPGGPVTAVLTGATGGIGRALVCQLLRQDIKVILGVRNVERARLMVEDIRGYEVPKCGSVVILSLDLSFFKSVNAFVRSIEELEDEIHLLINSGAVYDNRQSSKLTLTLDGFERHLQVNFLSHFLLTESLIPLLHRGSMRGRLSSKIINLTSSMASWIKKPVDINDLNFADTKYNPSLAYARSKYAMSVYTTLINDNLRKANMDTVVALNVYPGLVLTNIHEQPWTGYNHMMYASWRWLARFILNTPGRAADLIMAVALDPSIDEASPAAAAERSCVGQLSEGKSEDQPGNRQPPVRDQKLADAALRRIACSTYYSGDCRVIPPLSIYTVSSKDLDSLYSFACKVTMIHNCWPATTTKSPLLTN